MNHFRRTLTLFVVVLFTFLCASMVQAQATRTWVSGVGDDANPCSRTAPCKTFAGAISKTAPGGEISALDPGGFGAVTITKSITINGEGTLAGILAAGTNGVIINAPSDAVVYLRHITINGAGTGLDGIRFLAGRELHVEHVSIYGFTGDGIDMGSFTASAGGSFAFIDDVTINKLTGAGSVGVKVGSFANNFNVSMDRVHLERLPTGILVGQSGHITVRDSVITHGNTGIDMVNGATGSPSANIENTMLSVNTTGLSAGTGSTTRLSQVTIIECTTGINGAGGIVRSSGNNRILDNVSDGLTPAIINPK